MTTQENIVKYSNKICIQYVYTNNRISKQFILI